MIVIPCLISLWNGSLKAVAGGISESVSLSISPMRSIWVNKPINVSVSAVDYAGNGISSIVYLITSSYIIPDEETLYADGVWSNASSVTAKVECDGTWYICAQAFDTAGNRSPLKQAGTYRFDGTLPEIRYSVVPSTWTYGGVVINATGVDTGGSGIARICAPDGTWLWNRSFTYPIYYNGIYVIGTQDNAGNFKYEYVDVHNIDKTKPTGVFTPDSSLQNESISEVAFTVTDAGMCGLAYWKYRISADGGVTWGEWSSPFYDYAGNIVLAEPGDESGDVVGEGQGTEQWMLEADIVNNVGTHGNVLSGIYTFNAEDEFLFGLRITSIADPRWERYFKASGGNSYCAGLTGGGIITEYMPVYRTREWNGIKKGYKVWFEIDSAGLDGDQDRILLEACFYALDKYGVLHEADIFVRYDDGSYILLQDSCHATVSSSLTLDPAYCRFMVDDSAESETETGLVNSVINTWKFSYYLPWHAIAVRKGELYDPVNTGQFDYKLLVSFDIKGIKGEGGGIVQYEETEAGVWGSAENQI